MRLLDYSDWYDSYGETLENELLDWYNRCPEPYMIDDLPILEDYLNDKYEEYIGEYGDRAYDEYKDDMLMGDD
jgi:hypothetical protein